jgi:hypothetical protein
VSLPVEPDPATGPAAADARRLLEAVLGRAGRSDRNLRESALRAGAAPTGAVPAPDSAELGEASELVDKVARHAHRITDEDVAGLVARGTPEDVVLDLIVASAVGAGLARRAVGNDVVDRWERGR